MSKDRFDIVSKNQFSNATGNDAFPLGVGSKGTNVADLQTALNKLGANLSTDGILGNLTKGAVTSKGYSFPVSNDTFLQIQKDAYGTSTGGMSTMSETQLKALYNQQKASGKTKDDYATWLKKEMRLSKLKQIGQGLFQFSTEWLKAKQMGSQNPTGDNPPDQQTPTREGVPSIVWAIGGGVALILLIIGVRAIVKNRAVRMPQQRFNPAQQ